MFKKIWLALAIEDPSADFLKIPDLKKIYYKEHTFITKQVVGLTPVDRLKTLKTIGDIPSQDYMGTAKFIHGVLLVIPGLRKLVYIPASDLTTLEHAVYSRHWARRMFELALQNAVILDVNIPHKAEIMSTFKVVPLSAHKPLENLTVHLTAQLLRNGDITLGRVDFGDYLKPNIYDVNKQSSIELVRIHSSLVVREVLAPDSDQVLSDLFRLVPKQSEKIIEKTETKSEVRPTRSYSAYLKNLSDQASSIKSDRTKICAEFKNLSIQDKQALIDPSSDIPVPNLVNKCFKAFSSNLKFGSFSGEQKAIFSQNTALNFSEKTIQSSTDDTPCPFDAILDLKEQLNGAELDLSIIKPLKNKLDLSDVYNLDKDRPRSANESLSAMLKWVADSRYISLWKSKFTGEQSLIVDNKLISNKKGVWFFKFVTKINISSTSIDNYAKSCLNINKIPFIKEIIDNKTTKDINELNLKLTNADNTFIQHLRAVSNNLHAPETEIDDI